MRGALPSVAMLLAAISLAACNGPSETEAVPSTDMPSTSASLEQGVVMPLDAPPQEEPGPDLGAVSGERAKCEAEIGADAAARLVQRCIAVSPATHPPCHAANPCALIQDEIDRSCAMYDRDEDRPAECTEVDTPTR